MVCGQIHAPATLPNYVHVHLMNKGLLNLRNLVCLFRYAMQQGAFHYLLTIRYQCGRGIWHAVSQPKQTESLCDCHPRFYYEY